MIFVYVLDSFSCKPCYFAQYQIDLTSVCQGYTALHITDLEVGINLLIVRVKMELKTHNVVCHT